jgi:hypothetical protein
MMAGCLFFIVSSWYISTWLFVAVQLPKFYCYANCITAKIPSNSQHSRGQIPTGQRRPIPTGQRRGPVRHVATVGVTHGPQRRHCQTAKVKPVTTP